MSKKQELKLERRRLRKAARNRRLLWLGISVAVIISFAVLVQYWPRPELSPPRFVGIQHALVDENDNAIGHPSKDTSSQISHLGS